MLLGKIINKQGTMLLFFSIVFCSFVVNANHKPTELVVLTTFSEAPIRELMNAFMATEPDVNIKVIYRKTASAERLLKQQHLHRVDIIISSSASFFSNLIDNHLLAHTFTNKTIPDWLIPHGIALNDQVTALGYSGIGIMVNTQYLNQHQLPMPKTWQDLTHADFLGHVTMSTPKNSGTTLMMVESILQQYGWNKGWALLIKLGGNLASISARSFGVSEAVSRGLVAAGPVIDNYALTSMSHFQFIDFNYFTNSVILPTYLGITAQSNNNKTAKKLVNYLHSQAGQHILTNSKMRKKTLLGQEIALNSTFVIDKNILYQRDGLIKELYDQIITAQLAQLHDAWSMFYRIEKLVNNTKTEQFVNMQLLQQAKKLLITPPLSDAEAKKYFAVFERNKKLHHRMQSQQIQYQWRQIMTKQLDQAMLLLQDLALKLDPK